MGVLIALFLTRVWEVDAAARVGTIKNLVGVQGGPLSDLEGEPDLSEAYRAARIRLVRIPQDSANGLSLGGIFPNAAADPDDPKAYDFRKIDRAIEAIRRIDADVLWDAQYDIGRERPERVGVQTGRAPRDTAKWTKVVVRCLRHFNDERKFGVKYVEFVNEPFGCGGFDRRWRERGGPARKIDDIDPLDRERCWETFAAMARAIRAYDPRIRVVGPALAHAEKAVTLDLLREFVVFVRKNRVPVDAISFHCYATEPGDQARVAREVAAIAGDWPLINSEWNAWGHGGMAGDFVAAQNAATVILFQDTALIQAVRYRGDLSARFPKPHIALFDRGGKPEPVYHAFRALGEMSEETPERLRASGGTILAGRAKDGSKIRVVAVDMASKCDDVELILRNLPPGATVRVGLAGSGKPLCEGPPVDSIFRARLPLRAPYVLVVDVTAR